MRLGLGAPCVLRSLTSDGLLLFGTRSLRMFAYGFLSVVLVLYLAAEGLSEERIGFLLTMTLLGDVAISLWITTSADRFGRKRMLILGAGLMIVAGTVFALTTNFLALVAAATVGVLSPSDKEVGPFLSMEQAALAQTVADRRRTTVFAWYNLVGSLTAAAGALVAGLVSERLVRTGATGADVYRPLVVAYAGVGVLLALGFRWLSPAAESKGAGQPLAAPTPAEPRPKTGTDPLRIPATSPTTTDQGSVPVFGQTPTAQKPDGGPGKLWLGLHRSRRVVLRLSALFALDAFGGGFTLQSIVAYWFVVRFHLDPAALGSLFFVGNLLTAVSALGAAALANRFGLINTMVFTHLPSNVMLILVPLMPNATLAVTLYLVRFLISQMDVPTRQSYTMAVVEPDERSAASGITTVARSVGAAISPTLAGYLLADSRLLSFPFFIAGGVKIIYDLWLYRAFVSHRTATHSH